VLKFVCDRLVEEPPHEESAQSRAAASSLPARDLSPLRPVDLAYNLSLRNLEEMMQERGIGFRRVSRVCIKRAASAAIL
jgi:hypothetical protein